MDDLKTVLLVEDNAGDVRLAREAFGAFENVRLLVAPDGEEALKVLNKDGTHSDAPRPDLVLLDLNLPKVRGNEVLAHIKKDPSLGAIPTVILTSSELEADIGVSRSVANDCIKKPIEYDPFEALVKRLHDYWLTKDK
jgi:CheY-like chemotaxis protein